MVEGEERDLLVKGGDGDLDLLVEDRRSRVIFLGKILDGDDGDGDLVNVFEVCFIFLDKALNDDDEGGGDRDLGLLVRRFRVILLGKTFDCDDDIVCSGSGSLSSLFFSLPFSLLFLR